jgi:hypothetical protein
VLADTIHSQNAEAIMKLISQAADSIPAVIRINQPPRMPIELSICCLWALTGILFWALAFALGFGAEVTQALAMLG